MPLSKEGQKCYTIDMTNFDQIYDFAEGNYGIFTFAQAKAVGTSIRELDRWVANGRLERPARGVYRIVRFQPSPLDVYAVATESIGAGAYVYGESVLAMLKLTATNPTWIYVATGKRCRKSPREGLAVVRGVKDYVFTNYDGIRSQYLADALRSCRATVRPDRRIEAAHEGFRQGFLTREESRSIIREIKSESAT